MPADKPLRPRLPRSAASKADLDERDRYAKLTAGSADAVPGKRPSLAHRADRVHHSGDHRGGHPGAQLDGQPARGLARGRHRACQRRPRAGCALGSAGARRRGRDTPEERNPAGHPGGLRSPTSYEAHLADSAAGQLQWGIRAAAAAIALLFAGIVVTWVAPAAAPSGPALVAVHGGAVTCGTLTPAPQGGLRLTIAGGVAIINRFPRLPAWQQHPRAHKSEPRTNLLLDARVQGRQP